MCHANICLFHSGFLYYVQLLIVYIVTGKECSVLNPDRFLLDQEMICENDI